MIDVADTLRPPAGPLCPATRKLRRKLAVILCGSDLHLEVTCAITYIINLGDIVELILQVKRFMNFLALTRSFHYMHLYVTSAAEWRFYLASGGFAGWVDTAEGRCMLLW